MPGASSTRPSPTSFSSPIPAPRRTKRRSRWRAAASRSTAIPSAFARSPSRARSMAERSPRSPRAARPNISTASARRSTASIRFRSADLKAVEAAIGPETGSIMIEPIQGEGGVRVVPPSFLRGLREICDRRELLLIFDEVQTGVGRTGRLLRLRALRHPSRISSPPPRASAAASRCRRASRPRRRARPHPRRPRHDVWRQPARDGDRQRHARHRARPRIPRAGR